MGDRERRPRSLVPNHPLKVEEPLGGLEYLAIFLMVAGAGVTFVCGFIVVEIVVGILRDLGPSGNSFMRRDDQIEVVLMLGAPIILAGTGVWWIGHRLWRRRFMERTGRANKHSRDPADRRK